MTTAAAAPSTNTRQTLTFRTLDDIARFVEPLPARGATSTGRWSAAQNIEHIAAVIDASVDGFTFNAPFPIRVFATLMRKRFLTKGFNPGIKMPSNVPASFNPGPDTQLDSAVQHLTKSIQRAKDKKMTVVSPIFGALSHDQWIDMHCRHAEMHFSHIHTA